MLMKDTFKLEPEVKKCFKVPNNIVAVRISERKYQLAKMIQDGSGYSHFGSKPITGLREFELFGEKLNHQQMHDAVSELAKEETTHTS